jgi:ATP-dependent DNA ligase
VLENAGTRRVQAQHAGNDLTDRFPLIVAALNRLRSHSCITDGDAVDGLG